MNLCELRPAEGSRGKNWRRGRGHATGNGKTAGRGHKGAGQRSGTSGKCGFEGGQMPLYRRLPKRGFTCRNSKEIVAINVSMLNVFDNRWSDQQSQRWREDPWRRRSGKKADS